MSATGKVWKTEGKLAKKTITNTATCGCCCIVPTFYGVLTLVYAPIAIVATPFTLAFDVASCIRGSKNSDKKK